MPKISKITKLAESEIMSILIDHGRIAKP